MKDENKTEKDVAAPYLRRDSISYIKAFLLLTLVVLASLISGCSFSKTFPDKPKVLFAANQDNCGLIDIFDLCYDDTRLWSYWSALSYGIYSEEIFDEYRGAIPGYATSRQKSTLPLDNFIVRIACPAGTYRFRYGYPLGSLKDALKIKVVPGTIHVVCVETLEETREFGHVSAKTHNLATLTDPKVDAARTRIELMSLLASGDVLKQNYAIRYLGFIGDTSAIKPLETLMQQDERQKPFIEVAIKLIKEREINKLNKN